MSTIELRVPTADDVDWLNAADSVEGRGEFNDFGLPPGDHAREAEEGFITENHGTLIVQTADGTRVGSVSWRSSMYGPDERSRAWQLGIALLPEGRGHGYGGQALRLCADYLFEHTQVTRIEGQVDIDNIAGQRAMEKAGFLREGVARKAQFRRGAIHDMVVFSRVRDD